MRLLNARNFGVAVAAAAGGGCVTIVSQILIKEREQKESDTEPACLARKLQRLQTHSHTPGGSHQKDLILEAQDVSPGTLSALWYWVVGGVQWEVLDHRGLSVQLRGGPIRSP